MKLYHFTARHHYDGGPGHAGPGIKYSGLIPNIHPYFDAAGGMVWLTDLPDWSQPWAGDVLGIGCDRTEVRIEVAIPKRHRRFVLPWESARKLLITPLLIPHLEGDADPTRWFVFLSRVPSSWLREVCENPGHILTAELPTSAA